jgi:hypothetical protein
MLQETVVKTMAMRIEIALKIENARKLQEMEVDALQPEAVADIQKATEVNLAIESAGHQPEVVVDIQETTEVILVIEIVDLQPEVEADIQKATEVILVIESADHQPEVVVDIQETTEVILAKESVVPQMKGDTIEMIVAIRVDLNEESEAEMRQMKIDLAKRD